MNDFGKKYSFDIRKFVSGIIYIALIGVVAYGMSDHVYDGFGKAVPWIIIVLFAFMALVRMTESFCGKSFWSVAGELIEKLRGFILSLKNPDDTDRKD